MIRYTFYSLECNLSDFVVQSTCILNPILFVMIVILGTMIYPFMYFEASLT